MAARPLILALDQGTTSSRAIVFDAAAGVVAVAQAEFPQIYPSEGWVEHDPEMIWSSQLAVARQAMRAAEARGGEVVAIGVANQRETALVWERATGQPIYNAIVWQDRRTAELCRRHAHEGAEALIQARTGLLLDPYFSAAKVGWILDRVDGARGRAEMGELAFGTVDSFLLWRLTGGRVHATDATNASRTSLYDIHRNRWDPELLDLFRIPAPLLPEVKDCAAEFGRTEPELFGRSLPILGIAGDQQAAAIGQCGFRPGDIKATYGTGAFVLVNTGGEPKPSSNRLLTTIAYRLDGHTSYALEGGIFVAGAAVQWLRDGLGVIRNAAETEGLARGLGSNGGVYLVPAFTGLGAPHWDPDARGAIFGLTRATGPAELARAALESVCLQTLDLLKAMVEDGVRPATLKVDGGMVANDWLCQALADVLDLPVERPQVLETTALGAAYLAGRRAGIYGDFDAFRDVWRLQKRFDPQMDPRRRRALVEGWRDAVRRTRTGG
ncbi:MAG: glycerol kinase GlpK [Caulobacteraceae bacterium]